MPALDLGDSTSEVLSLVALGVAFVVAIFFGYRYLQLKREEEEDVPETTEELLAEFERAFYAGEMDRAEFDRVKASLLGQKPGAAAPERPTPPPGPSSSPPEQG